MQDWQTDKTDVIPGEAAGSFLLGLIESFRTLHILPESILDFLPPDIQPDQWYPLSVLVETLRKLEALLPDAENIFFQAGIHFLRIWYEHGPGKDMIDSGLSWLNVNKEMSGYNSVVRGEDHLVVTRFVDEEAGTALMECITPIPISFARGLTYGGCILFDDMEYVEVTAENVCTYDKNPALYKYDLIIKFRLAPHGVTRNLDEKICSLTIDCMPDFTVPDLQSLVWRYKSIQQRLEIDKAYHRDISGFLTKALATTQIQRDEIERLSNQDSLTGLPNLRLAQDRLKMSCNKADREKRIFALLFIDLDGFKDVNDTYGHDAGDCVLQTIASRVTGRIRQMDTMARKGGDEFLVILNDIPDAAVQEVAKEILSAISKPIPYNEENLNVSGSIGIAIYPTDAKSPEELIQCADEAMYRVKKSGKNGIEFYCTQ